MFSLRVDPRVKLLRDFFYQGIAEKALRTGIINKQNVEDRLKIAIQSLIEEILNNSLALSDGFKLYQGFTLHQGNCPPIYDGFFKALMNLKQSHPHNQYAIKTLADGLMKAPGFTEMLPKLKAFLLGEMNAKKLKDFFYNRLLELTVMQEGLNAHNFDEVLEGLLKSLIKEVLEDSKNYGATIVFGPEKITSANCPEAYQALYQAMANLNQNRTHLSASGIDENISGIANALRNSVAFKLMFPKLKQFALEALGPQEESPSAVASIRQVPAIAPKVTIQDIRNTFYQHMQEQLVIALQEGLITLEDLESQESWLYMGLPGLALLAALNESSDYLGGLLLSNGAVVDKNNCPKEDDFLDFLNTLLLCKARVQELYGNGAPVKLPLNDYKRIQYHCLTQDIPEGLEVENTVSAAHCAKIINTIALKISQNAEFKKMVGSVIEEASQCYQSRGPGF